MDPERWRRVADLFELARELEPSERTAFLIAASGGDDALRREVESLLVQPTHQVSMERALAEATRAVFDEDSSDLGPGTLLGPYRIESLLGAGGMGRVYSATDTRLGRPVAVKVLPKAVATDPRFRARFDREAQTIASLSHPHICTLHDIGHQNGVDFLVMERLEGVTLAARLEAGRLPFDRALTIAIEVADALTAAHRLGIVHRDLKPGNIMLTKTGSKLLDFGLAKAVAPFIGGTAPTRASTMTAEGTIVGTFQYMAPEQLEAKETDARTDIFSFGAVVYEMLTGKKAFEGKSQASLIAAILHDEPAAISASQPLAPPALDRIASRCMAKDPDDRWQDARDLMLELNAVLEDSKRPAMPLRPHEHAGRPSASSAARALLVLALCLAVGTVAFLVGSRRSASPLPRVTRLTFERGTIRAARFAPDGKTVIYGASWRGEPLRVFQTRLGSVESSPLHVPDAEVLAVSPTNEVAISIGHRFRSWTGEGTLALAPLVGGSFRELVANVRAADWSPDGTELAIVRRVNGRDRLEYPIGNVLHETTGYVSHPRVSPSGQAVAYLDHPIFDDNRGRVSVVTRARERRSVSREWAAVDGLVWSRDGREIWFAASDAGRNILFATSLDGRLRQMWAAPADLTILDIGPEGQVLVTANTIRTEVKRWAARDSEERDISWHAWSYAKDVTADGRTVLFTRYGEGTSLDYQIGIRKLEIAGSVVLGKGVGQLFSPDNKWVVGLTYSEPGLFLLPTGAGERRTLTAPGFNYITAGWFHDGKRVIFAARHNDAPPAAYVQSVEGGEPVRISEMILPLRSDWAIRVSPDDSWFFGAQATGPPVIVSVSDGRPRVLHKLGPDALPVAWTADSQAIVIVRPSSDPLTAVIARVELATGVIRNLREINVSDKSGGRSLSCVTTPDASTIVCNVGRYLTDLYLVENLR